MQSHFVQLSFGAHMANHHETGGHILQHLRDIFAQLAQLALTFRAYRFFRLVPARLSRKMIRQCAPRGLRCRRSRRGGDRSRFWRVGLFLAAIRFQFLQPQLQLLDLPRELLRLTPKLHAMQLGQQQLQMLDLALARLQLLLRGGEFAFREIIVFVRLTVRAVPGSALAVHLQEGAFRSGSATTDMRGVSHELARSHPRARKKSCAKESRRLHRQLRLPGALRPPPIDAFQQHR